MANDKLWFSEYITEESRLSLADDDGLKAEKKGKVPIKRYIIGRRDSATLMGFVCTLITKKFV